MIIRLLLNILFLFGIVSLAYTNGGPIDGSSYQRTGTISPKDNVSVQLVEENLKIKLEGDAAVVEVIYILQNGNDSTKVDFGFPVDISQEFGDPGSANIQYSIADGNAPLNYKIIDDTSEHMITIDDKTSIKCKTTCFVSNLMFHAQEKKCITVKYRIPCSFTDWAVSKTIFPIYYDRRFMYSFSFASGWADGSIGKLSVKIDTSALSEPGIKIKRVLPSYLVNKNPVYEFTMKNVQAAALKDLVIEYDVSEKKLADFFITHKADVSEISIKTSSHLKGNYSPSNMLDGNTATVWAEGVEGNGEGQWIELTLNGTQIGYLGILNGVILSEELYKGNARIASLKVDCYTLNDGVERNMYGDNYIINLKDCSFKEAQNPVQILDVGMFAPISRIRLTIISTYPGTKYEDCCITDLIILK